MLAELFYALSAISLVLIAISVLLIISGKKSPFTLLLAGLIMLGVGITLAAEGLQIPTGTDEYSYYWDCYMLRNNCSGVPEPDSCEEYTEAQCLVIPDCTWNVYESDCVGAPELDSCEPYNQTQCEGISNCTWNAAVPSSCAGTPDENACAAYNETQCNAIENCTFDQGCYGTPNNCTWLTTYDPTGFKCNETAGCTVKWPEEENCTGTVDNCTQLQVWGQTKCNETEGCEWIAQTENCTGDVAVTCMWLGAFDSTGTKCQETPGCVWNLTLFNGTCDRILINNTYLNMSGDWDNPHSNIDLLYYIYILGGIFFIIWGAVNIYENREENEEEEE